MKTEYLARLFLQQGGSIVDYLNSLGIDSSRTNRAKLAQQYGIEGYKGTAEQNMKPLSLMRKDKSKKEPVQQKQNKPAQQTTSKPKNPQVPSFDEWLYVTGLLRQVVMFTTRLRLQWVLLQGLLPSLVKGLGDRRQPR